VDRTVLAAAAAAAPLAALSPARRCELLRAVASALDAARDELVRLADAETALGEARLDGELTRTCVQLEMFADVVAAGADLDVIIDLADPAAVPAPRPDLRRMLVPIGPVGVFAASNFPFAFSVAGGDTASALAAGCPVVVKAHPDRPGLSQRTWEIVAAALTDAGAPAGTFGLVRGVAAGRDLVTHPAIKAVGFTGSLAAGRALFDLAVSRPDPIPFYGELGSLNPVVVTAGALTERADDVVTGFIGSLTLGSGQFCTKPGLLFLPSGHGLADAFAKALAGTTLGPLLSEKIRNGFEHSRRALAAVAGVRAISDGSTVDRAASPSPASVAPALFAVSADDLLRHRDDLLVECFGPAGLVVEYDTADQLVDALAAVPGALTATVHAASQPAADEARLVRRLLGLLTGKAGRVIWGGWPTGVAVTWAQHHGGPWPATTAPLHTSVGVTAIRRFQRPVVYQNLPDELLPEPLRDANPWGLPRRVNGQLHNGPITR